MNEESSSESGSQVATLSLAKNEREALQVVVVADRDPPVRSAAQLPGGPGGVCGVSYTTSIVSSAAGGSGLAAVTVQPIGYVHTGPCPWDAENKSFCNLTHPIYCKTGLLNDPTHTPTCVSAIPPGYVYHNLLVC